MSTISGAGGVFNVADYLAAGFSQTDAIQRAIVDASEATGNYAAKVVIPAGLYAITKTLKVSKALGIVIEGVGSATILEWKGGYAADAPEPLLHLESCQYATVRDLMIHCGDPSYRLAEGVRLSSNPLLGIVSTHCAFHGVRIGGVTDQIETCVRIGSEEADSDNLNNDFHTFINCGFANYGRDAVAITGSQVYQVLFVNCSMQGLVHWSDAASPTARVDAGGSQLVFEVPLGGSTPPQPFFTAKDVGKVVELVDTQGQPLLRAQLASTASSSTTATTQLFAYELVLPSSPSTPFHAAAAVSGRVVYGSQCAVRNVVGSFSFLGGAVSNHLYTDFAIGTGANAYRVSQAGNAGASTIRDTIAESSRQFLVTGGPAGDVLGKTLLDNVRVAGDRVSTLEPEVIAFKMGGELFISNSSLGDADNPRSLKVNYGGGSQGHSQFVMVNSIISSTYATSLPYLATNRVEQLFPNCPPNEVINCRHTSGTGSMLIGNRPPPYPFWKSTQGAVDVDFTLSRTRQIVISGETTFNFTQLYDGLGTPMRLYVTHNHGPYPLHFPASPPPSTGAPHAPSYTVVWPSGGAYDSTRSAAGMTDLFELTYDGATLFARVLGQAFAPSPMP